MSKCFRKRDEWLRKVADARVQKEKKIEQKMAQVYEKTDEVCNLITLRIYGT